MFQDSVANNICLGNDNANVQELLDKVGIKEFRADDMIEENGKNLSGGQKKRISLERALNRGKNILFLYEAITNLDEESTQMIENIVLDSDLTVVMITHKLSEKSKEQLDEVSVLGK